MPPSAGDRSAAGYWQRLRDRRLQKRNRREPQLATVQQDGDKPVFAPVASAGLRPFFSGQLDRQLRF
jgi:hypothetical protein